VLQFIRKVRLPVGIDIKTDKNESLLEL
jgi:hypothetical protein